MHGIKNFTKYSVIAVTLLFTLSSFAADSTATPTPASTPTVTPVPTPTVTSAPAPTPTVTSTPATTATQGSEAGKVVITFGKEVKATDAAKKERALTRQSPVFQGDTLVTGKESRMQLRLSDDTALVLRPDSEFRIDEYKYDAKDVSQNKNFVSMTKGGLRLVTGAIAKADNTKFLLKTPVAVLGIRGTEFIAVLKDGKLYVTVISGAVMITNKAGTITIGIGQRFQNAVVNSENAMPEGLVEPMETISPCKAS